jgi:hypothetical protein
MNKPVSKNLYDYTGIVSSALCIIHCLASPLVLLWLGGQSENPWMKVLEFLFLALSLFAVSHAVAHTKLRTVRLLLPVFFAVLAVSVMGEEMWTNARFLSYGASAGLIGLHLVNLRYCKH